MARVISLIFPMALLILAAACGNSDTPVPTAAVGLIPTTTPTATVDLIPTPTPTPQPRPTATNGASGPIPCGSFEDTPDPGWEYHLRIKNSTGVDFDCLTLSLEGNRTDFIDFKDGQITEYQQAISAFEFCVSVIGYVNGERYSAFTLNCLGYPGLPPGFHTYELTLTGETNITGDKDILVTATEHTSTNQIAAPVVVGEFPTSSFDCSGRFLGYIPGLGGLFFGPNTDETRVSVFLTDPDNQEAIREVACLWPERDLVRVLQADYTLSQLRGWHRQLGQTSVSGEYLRGFPLSGPDEKTNRIVYTFYPVRGIRERFDTFVVAAGVPEDAFLLKSGCANLEGEYTFSPPTVDEPSKTILENIFVELIVPNTVAYGADLPLVIEITNTSSETLDLEIGTGEKYGYGSAFDFWIAPGGDQALWHWNCGKAFLAILGWKSLAPGEKIVLEGTWGQVDHNSEPVAPGTYLVNGIAMLGIQWERDRTNRIGGYILGPIPVTVLP